MSTTRSVLRITALTLLLLTTPVQANPDKASAFYEDALARFNREDFAGSIIQIKNALQQDSKMLAAHVLLGRSLLKMGELATAEVALNTSLNLGVARSEVLPLLAKALFGQGKYPQLLEKVTTSGLPPSAQLEVLVLRGSAQSELGDTAAASKSFEEARAIDANSVAVMLADSALHLKIRRPEVALALTERALSVAPNDADAWSAKANVLAALRKPQDALITYGKALSIDPRHLESRIARATIAIDLGQDAAAKLDVDELSRVDAGEPRVALLRATLASRRGDDKAVQLALGEAVAAIDPLSPEVRARRPQLLMIGGSAHYGLGNTQKAREYLEVLVRMQPRNVGATKLLAASFLAAGDAARAATLLEGVRGLSPNDPSLLTLLGNANLVQKRFAKAAALYQEAAQHGAANSPDLMSNFGLSLAGLNQNAQAEQQLQAAFKARPGDLRTGMALATLQLKRQDSKAAVAVLTQVVASNPNNPLGLNMLGVAHGASGNFPAARQAYEKALGADRKFSAAQLNLARLDVATGKLPEARKQLDNLLRSDTNNTDAMFEMARIEQAAGNLPEAIRWLDKARATDGRNVRVTLQLAEIHLASRQPLKAVEAAKSALSVQPENLAVLTTMTRAQIANQDLAGARGTLATMTRLVEFDPDQQVMIARLQLQAANPSGASYSLGKALTTKPDHFPALALQAELALQSGDVAQAETLGKQLVAKYPDRAAGHHILGDVAANRGQAAVALSLHRTALAREPGTEAALRVFRAHLFSREAVKGVAFLQEWQRGSKQPDPRIAAAISEGQMIAGDWRGARTSLEQLIRSQGETPATLNNLAYVLMKLGDPGELATAERAWKLAGTSPEVIDTYGWALARAGRHDQALRLLRDARLRAPQSATIRYHLGWTLAAAGRKNEAREEISAAIKDAPKGFDGIEDARKLLAELSR